MKTFWTLAVLGCALATTVAASTLHVAPNGNDA
jgi:hypothetical protein